MKERPILFSGSMVNAILEGRKTMTRRAVKSQPIAGEGVCSCPHCESGWAYTVNGGACSCGGVTNRYGNHGDRLWVKETFSLVDGDELYFRATDSALTKEEREEGMKWKPSIFMPRWASRITLEIVETRIERLNDISEDDAIAEGIQRIDGGYGKPLSPGEYGRSTARRAFQDLWESINGAESWNANPFVWVIEFKRLKGGAV